MKIKIKHDYKCDNCKKPATYNLQDWWHLYDINNKGDFQEIKDWEASTNEFWCESCYHKECRE